MSSESAKKKQDDPPKVSESTTTRTPPSTDLSLRTLLSFLSMVVSVATAVRWIRLGVGPLAFWRSVRARREGHLEAHLENLVNLENPVRRTPRGGVLVSRSETLRDAHDITQSVPASAFAAAAVAVGAAAAIATSPAKRLEGEVAEKRES